MAFNEKWPWDIIGVWLTVVVILLYCIAEFLLPLIRRQRLKSPCDVYFHIRSLQNGILSYALQDDRGHSVKEIVLPSNSINDVEITCYPKINFHQEELIFGCDAENDDSKPVAIKRFTAFVQIGQSEWVPGRDASDYIDRNGYYHIRQPASRSVGTCYTVGFKLRTQKAGVYKASVSFLTDEIEGNGYLQIRVEDKPSTMMECDRGHWKCKIKPMVSAGFSS